MDRAGSSRHAPVTLVDWRVAVDGLHEAVVAANVDNRVVYMNRAAEMLLGWARDDLVGEPLTVIMPERFRAAHQVGFERYVSTRSPVVMGRPLRVPVIRADGAELEVDLVVTAASVGDEPVLVGLLRDISDRLELEGAGDLADTLVGVLAEASTLAEAVPRVLAGLGESLNWDVVQLWLADDDGSMLHHGDAWVRAGVDAEAFVASGDLGFERGIGLPGRVWVSAQPAWIEDVTTDRRFPRGPIAEAAGLRAAFAFPLIAHGRVLGAVEMLSRQAHGISDDLVRRMAALGVRLGEFIDRRVAEEGRLSLLESERKARAEAERARARLAFLADASTALSRSLDLDVTLAELARLTVPALADWCVIHLLVGEEITVAAVAHADDEKVRALRAVHEQYPVDLGAPDGVGLAIRTGAIVRHDAVSDDLLRSAARDDRHLELMRALDLGAAAVIPLHVRNEPIGALTVATHRERALVDDTVETAMELARRAAMAIDNARLFRDLQLQTALLRTRGEAGVEGQLIVGPDGDMISYNRRFREMWNLDDEVLSGGSDERALAVAAEQVIDPERFRARAERLYAERVAAREEITLQDGRVFDRVGTPLFEGGAYLGYAWYFRDVTAHKRIESELADAAARSAALARTLQQSLLPPTLPEIPGLQLGASYVPASEGIEVGGDFYDVFRLGRDTWGLVVGDVCGHGAEAAAVTAFARYTLRAAAAQTRSPARALRSLNDAMLREGDDARAKRFVTVANARVSVGRGSAVVTVALGGHPRPVVRQRDGSVRLVGRPGTLLGAFHDVTLHDTRIELRSGDCIVLVTDGVLEARHDGEQFGIERLLDVVRANGSADADELAKAITGAATAHADHAAADDIAVLVLAVA